MTQGESNPLTRLSCLYLAESDDEQGKKSAVDEAFTIKKITTNVY